MIARKDEPTSEAMIRKMWFDLFDYALKRPNFFLFIEYAGAAQVINEEQAKSISYMQKDIAGIVQRALDDKTLAPMPASTASVLFISPALHLARSAILNRKPISSDELEITFKRVWISLTTTL